LFNEVNNGQNDVKQVFSRQMFNVYVSMQDNLAS